MAARSLQCITAAAVVTLLLSGCGEDSAVGDAASSASPSAGRGPLEGIGVVELVADGFSFTEGPQWMADDGVLVFTDGDSILQLGDDDTVEVFRSPSHFSNGLAVDPDGRLLAAEAGAAQITRTEPDGTVTTLADTFEGVSLNQPNDLVARSDGTIYFTDPVFGEAATAARELDFHGIFRIAPDGNVTAERRGEFSELPNGIALSPDERRLYATDYAQDLVRVFDVAADGSLSEGTTFVSTGAGPDGMAVDDAGNLYVTTELGIEVLAPDGTAWGVIPVPKVPANCAFGGPDGRTLFITAREGLYRVELTTAGPPGPA